MDNISRSGCSMVCCVKIVFAVEGQLARWTKRPQQYDFKIKNRPVKSYHNSDSLSRRTCKKHCERCHQIRDDWTKEPLRTEALNDNEVGPILRAKIGTRPQ
ncbi:hypothetical protein NQ317_010014 [Molorchus minor]|uniref:Uncharacterized protein n=1 Tax=Molorchus minor TaxID=1323400 RepID=A0ABQ9J5Q1_9CUCU|nr:hypothetical protein NQ317_010014 [Molorchus minor]